MNNELLREIERKSKSRMKQKERERDRRKCRDWVKELGDQDEEREK